MWHQFNVKYEKRSVRSCVRSKRFSALNLLAVEAGVEKTGAQGQVYTQAVVRRQESGD